MEKVRCSSLGKVMTFPRSKSAEISKTALTYVKELIIQERWGVRKEFRSKYTDKGNEVELQAKNIAARVLGYGVLLKNEKRFENEYLTGTPDVILPNEIIDIKSSWNAFTFPFFDEEIPNKEYYWQGVGYCMLTGKRKFKIIYVLTDTPEHIIEREVWSKVREFGCEYDDIYDEVKAMHTFSHIPENERVKVFEYEVTDEIINQVINQLKIIYKWKQKLSI